MLPNRFLIISILCCFCWFLFHIPEKICWRTNKSSENSHNIIFSFIRPNFFFGLLFLLVPQVLGQFPGLFKELSWSSFISYSCVFVSPCGKSWWREIFIWCIISHLYWEIFTFSPKTRKRQTIVCNNILILLQWLIFFYMHWEKSEGKKYTNWGLFLAQNFTTWTAVCIVSEFSLVTFIFKKSDSDKILNNRS